MTTTEFLTLIGAPWKSFHDHPDANVAKDVCDIRSAAKDPHWSGREVTQVYGCSSPYGDVKAMQRARRDLIERAPDLYAYVAAKAAQGDAEAKKLIGEISGDGI